MNEEKPTQEVMRGERESTIEKGDKQNCPARSGLGTYLGTWLPNELLLRRNEAHLAQALEFTLVDSGTVPVTGALLGSTAAAVRSGLLRTLTARRRRGLAHLAGVADELLWEFI